MKILFISRKVMPHIGGVEKHIDEVTKVLLKKGHKVRVISENDVNYPHLKFIGLLYIWLWIWQNRDLIQWADAVHIHDVFVWYLPFRFLFSGKAVYTTLHGWETKWPIPIKNIFLKKIAVRLSNGTIAIGEYIEKYYGVKSNKVIYGGQKTKELSRKAVKIKRSIAFIGRLDHDTGIIQFLKWKNSNKSYNIDFVGDGPLHAECEKYGTVHGFCDPTPFLQKAEYCVPGGYLAALEGLANNCKLKLFWNNKVKEDYWKMSPFYKLKGQKLKNWAKAQTWEKLANDYLDLYHSI